MSLAPGTRLGPYEVLSQIGAGGMGEVYKARDTRLDRSVAIKVLPAELSSDPERRARFEREARAIASLAHPHICTLHDIGTHDGTTYLVMEHLAGESLADRVARGPVPFPQALDIAAQIGEALDAAHKHGIIHRDLKPGNVMLTSGGAGRSSVATAKLLDFGLAKLAAHGERPAVAGGASVPTQAAPVTAQGTILGTLQYMAPEQLEGKEADARTDLWALGAILFEMLTGRRAFEGESQVSLIGSIMNAEPAAISTLQPLTPPSLDRLVRKCLAKRPDDRWDTAHDVADELRWVRQTLSVAGPEALAPSRRRRYAWLSVLGLCVVSAAAGAVLSSLLRSDRSPTRGVSRAFIDLRPAERLGTMAPRRTPGGSTGALAFSRDGRLLAFVGVSGKTSTLYVRPLDGSEATPIAAGVWPVFSPDGAWIAFRTRDRIMKAPVEGGPPVEVCSVPILQFRGLDWGDDDHLVFSSRGMLWRVAASGGNPEPLTQATQGETHVLPHVLPAARAVLYTVQKYRRLWGEEQVVVQPLPVGERKVLFRNGTDAHYLAPGHIVFMRLGTLMAVPFDAVALKLTGGAVGIQEEVAQVIGEYNDLDESGTGQFALCQSGTLAYISARLLPPIQGELVWMDRKGRATPLPGQRDSFWPFWIRISPDGYRLATITATHRESSLWLSELDRDNRVRIPTDGQVNAVEWTPDGRRLVYSFNVEGVPEMLVSLADGTGAPEKVDLGVLPEPWPASWTPDGKTLALARDWSTNAAPGTTRLSLDEGGRGDIWTLSFGQPSPVAKKLVATPSHEQCPAFSPDGRWVAYESDDSRRPEVYVQAYPGSGPRTQVSEGGGSAPAWHPSGRELFYGSLPGPDGTGMLMSVQLSGGSPLHPSKPRPLFSFSAREISFGCGPVRLYDLSPDGERFVVMRKLPDPPPPPLDRIQIVHSWGEIVKARAPLPGSR